VHAKITDICFSERRITWISIYMYSGRICDNHSSILFKRAQYLEKCYCLK